MVYLVGFTIEIILRNIESLLRSKYLVKLIEFLGPRSFTTLSKQPTAGPYPDLH